MSIYETMQKAKDSRDVALLNTCYHDDWEFKFHSTGHIMKRGDNSDEEVLERWDKFGVENERCLYENDDVLVTHQIVSFPNGTKDAVMMVHVKKDGLLWRTETGSTALK